MGTFARERSRGNVHEGTFARRATGDRTVAWERSRGAMGDITVARERSRGAMGERIVARERSRGATFRATVEIPCCSDLPNVILQIPSAKIKSYILSAWIMNTLIFALTLNDIIDQGVKHLHFLGELHLQSRHQVNLSSSNPSGNVVTGAALGSVGSTDGQSTT